MGESLALYAINTFAWYEGRHKIAQQLASRRRRGVSNEADWGRDTVTSHRIKLWLQPITREYERQFITPDEPWGGNLYNITRAANRYVYENAIVIDAEDIARSHAT